ncbi:MAG TPA: glycosyltransferase family 2 protein [Thermoanaerobaculia bacterium]|nr:glycosyltransferase family 2 protein [Thermoanaerobaculia bacterium]
MSSPDTREVSICIVSLNCWEVLRDCLESLRASPDYASWEVILVDNASTDGTADAAARLYPEVRLIRNNRNVGFTRATNQGFRVSTGRYLLWLNPDTLVAPDSIRKLVGFLESNEEAAVVGPKVLNGDGSFQAQCRRGLPSPSASLFHMLRFDRLWPKRRAVGEYLLTYLPIDESAPVVSVSGCCLLCRRSVWDRIGPLDEAMFGFGEDIDWCMRARDAGWQVWYWPGTSIVHLKGHGGVHSKPFHKVWGIHQCMWLVYKKHFASRYKWPVSWLVRIAVGMSFAVSAAAVAVRRVFQRIRRRAA